MTTAFISTGHLPPPELVQELVEEAHRRYAGHREGTNSKVYPALERVSPDWLYDIGLPGKSGISGGVITVSPGKGGLGTFAPPLDPAGNSVKGQLVAKFLSRTLGLDLFLSRPVN